MDIVTWVTACAVGVQAELFVPLGPHELCAAADQVGAQVRPPELSPTIDRWAPDIAAASRRFGVPSTWLRQVMRLESGGAADATSSAGAMGLMQLMPSTYAELTARYRLGDDPYEPSANIAAGAAYLREMLDRFGAPGAFAAYNAGPGRMADHLMRGRSLPSETQRYVARIIGGVPDTRSTGDWSLVAVEGDMTATGDEQQIDGAAAAPMRPARASSATSVRRERIAAGRSAALFVPRGSTVWAIGAGTIGVIGNGRDGALFVPLESGDRPRLR